MAKRIVVNIHEAWWVWIGEGPVIRVATQADAAVAHLVEHGAEYGTANSSGRFDMACAVAEVLWNDPLPKGDSFHKTILSPAMVVLHGGVPRTVLGRVSPSKLAALSKNSEWWVHQYQAAFTSPGTLVLRGRKSVADQIAARFGGAAT